MKLAFKGTSSQFICQGLTKYELYKTYTKEDSKTLRICSSDGYHYCNNIKDVGSFYSFNKENRFFIIEVLGEFNDDGNKSITTSFRFLKEITEEVRKIGSLSLSNDKFLENFIYPEKEIAEYQYKEIIKKEILEEIQKVEERKKKDQEDIQQKLKIKFENNLNLDVVKKIQEEYPTSIVAGSVALYLHGVRLGRWLSAKSDIDIIIPYYTPFKKLGNEEFYIPEEDDFPSNSDFEERLMIKDIKVDICINPKAKWSYIEYNGFKYKVNNLENIWEAKIRYGKRKHIQDLKEALIITEVRENISTFFI
jgi:hypothetical protein